MPLPGSQPDHHRRHRYAIVGTGARARMYVDSLTGRFAEQAELVAWSDVNPGRLDVHERRLNGAIAPQRFSPEDLADAVQRHRIDRVIVTSPDDTHAGPVATALRAGAGVIVEKPLTVDEPGIRRIAEAVSETGLDVTTTFNYRYSPRNYALRQVIASGSIGTVTSVHFEWLLDTAHGADYFRRWHREKRHSGGLLVHKASHHFDLVNWWIADRPARVYASGGLRFYGAEAARRRNLGPRPERGTSDSPYRDRFSLDLRTQPDLHELYRDQEHHDGYRRDRDVFDAGIDIEDNLSLVVDYRSGASMSYSLNAHSPWEGYTVAINGTAGRAELSVVERGSVSTDTAGHVIIDPSAAGSGRNEENDLRPVREQLLVQGHFESAVKVPIPAGVGGHGGGDAELLRDIFIGRTEPDPLQRAASWVDGVRSISVGLAGNRSLATGRPVSIRDLDLGPHLPE